eukprot:15481328-Alexandrium_andersonii.AAC.1
MTHHRPESFTASSTSFHSRRSGSRKQNTRSLAPKVTNQVKLKPRLPSSTVSAATDFCSALPVGRKWPRPTPNTCCNWRPIAAAWSRADFRTFLPAADGLCLLSWGGLCAALRCRASMAPQRVLQASALSSDLVLAGAGRRSKAQVPQDLGRG